jgi:hypothetical protein
MSVKKHALKTPIRTRFASKVIMFKETLEFKQAILLCYIWRWSFYGGIFISTCYQKTIFISKVINFTTYVCRFACLVVDP